MKVYDADLKRILCAKSVQPLLKLLRDRLMGRPLNAGFSNRHSFPRIFLDTLSSANDPAAIGNARDAVMRVLDEAERLEDFSMLPGMEDLMAVARRIGGKVVALKLCDIAERTDPAAAKFIEMHGNLVFSTVSSMLYDDDLYWRISRMFLDERFDRFRPTMFFRMAAARGVKDEFIAMIFADHMDRKDEVRRERTRYGFSQHLSAIDLKRASEFIAPAVLSRLIKHFILANRYADMKLLTIFEQPAPQRSTLAAIGLNDEQEFGSRIVLAYTANSERSDHPRRVAPVEIEHQAAFLQAKILWDKEKPDRGNLSIQELLDDPPSPEMVEIGDLENRLEATV